MNLHRIYKLTVSHIIIQLETDFTISINRFLSITHQFYVICGLTVRKGRRKLNPYETYISKLNQR